MLQFLKGKPPVGKDAAGVAPVNPGTKVYIFRLPVMQTLLPEHVAMAADKIIKIFFTGQPIGILEKKIGLRNS